MQFLLTVGLADAFFKPSCRLAGVDTNSCGASG
jgi:hypothetical protein